MLGVSSTEGGSVCSEPFSAQLGSVGFLSGVSGFLVNFLGFFSRVSGFFSGAWGSASDFSAEGAFSIIFSSTGGLVAR